MITFKRKKGSKYKNVKTSDGFDSKKERKRFLELEMMQKAGVIKCLAKQAPFELLPTFKDKQGNTERGIKYIADFVFLCSQKKKILFFLLTLFMVKR